MTEETAPQMLRFWFCVLNESPLFHTSMTCPSLNAVVRDRENLSVAHIPVDSNEVGAESELRFCSRCGEANPFPGGDS